MENPIANPGDLEGLKAKQANVDAYKASMAPVKPEPVKPFGKAAPVDKVNPKGKYGDKPGEKRIDVSGMTKPLPSYKHGIDYVPKTGPAILHKGERVTPEKDNMKDKVYGKVHEGDGKPPKKIKEIRTRKSASGGHIHEHHHHHPEHHPMEEHTSPDDKAMIEHMTANAGGDGMTAAPPPAGPQGMPGGATGGAQSQDQALGM
jgi:hypothetical protein